jgi:hypothetical protein
VTCKPANTVKLLVSVTALLLLSAAYVHAADTTDQPATDTEKKVYKQVGPDGQIIYSDKPSPGSQEVTVPTESGYKPVKPPAGFTPYQPPPKTPASTPIANAVTIIAPKPEESIWSAVGEVTVSVSLGSALSSGQKLEYLIDGQSVLSGSETSHTFSNINRGAHVLTVRLTDSAGNSVTSQPVTFYVHRPVKKN